MASTVSFYFVLVVIEAQISGLGEIFPVLSFLHSDGQARILDVVLT